MVVFKLIWDIIFICGNCYSYGWFDVFFFFIIYWNCFIRLGDESGGRGLD